MADMRSEDQMKGCFITVEGSEGSGKTTSIAYISQWLTEHNIDFVQTREPGGTLLAEHLRELLLNPMFEEAIDDVSELLLVFAARAQHIKHVIKPALAEGKTVVCDRFTDTTWAYQGGGRQINQQWIGQLEIMVQKNLRPDMTIFLDIPVCEGLKRAGLRSQPDRFETEDIAFFERIRNVFLERANTYKRQFRVIDATPSITKVNEALNRTLAEYFNL